MNESILVADVYDCRCNNLQTVYKKDHAGLLQYLLLLRLAPIHLRISAMSLLTDLLEDKASTALSSVVAEPAFFDSLIGLLIKAPRR